MKAFQTAVAVTLILFASLGFSDNLHYQIMMDAGSTGTRLHIFQIDKSTPVPTINKVFSESIKPGLSAYADQPEEAGPGLKKLLDDAQAFMDKKELKETEIQILATAGMRLLPTDKQEKIYAHLTQYLHQYSFKIGEVKTISGELEGLFGWLDVNYLLGNFQHHKPTIGSIDMGGASTQIAYESKIPAADRLSLTIDSQPYLVCSRSFNGLGQEEVLQSMTKNKDAAACFPQNYAYLDQQKGFFNMQSCGQIYSELIHNKKVETQIDLNPEQSFIAYSGIYYTFNFFKADKEPRQSLLESKIQEVCYQDWEHLKQEYPYVADKYRSSYCAHAVYENELLFNVYKLQAPNLTVSNTLEGQDIDWALGAVLYSLVVPNPTP